MKPKFDKNKLKSKAKKTFSSYKNREEKGIYQVKKLRIKGVVKLSSILNGMALYRGYDSWNDLLRNN